MVFPATNFKTKSVLLNTASDIPVFIFLFLAQEM